MKPKDQDPKDNKGGLIYSYRCQDITCGEEYIGETGRTLVDRHKEHLKGVKVQNGGTEYEGICIVLCLFLDNSGSPFIVEQ